MKHPLLADPLNRDIVACLAICDLPHAEKRLIANALVHLTAEEKKALRDNLEQEVKLAVADREEALRKFVESLGGAL